MSSRSFLILHGLQASGPGHWQTWLAARLRADNERVAYPGPAGRRHAVPAAWRGVLEGELAALPAGEVIVVCHSLSCVLWLQHVADGGAQADRLLLVAPPSESADVPEIEAFFPVPLPALIAARGSLLRRRSLLPRGRRALYGEPLGIPVDVLEGAGHLNPEAGFGPWPAVEAWCLDGDRPITG